MDAEYDIDLTLISIDKTVHFQSKIHEIKPTDANRSRNFLNQFLESNAGFSSKIIFSDEVYFTLGLLLNKQLCVY